MIVLFKETAGGKPFMKKEELIKAAEDSGIAHKPIRGDPRWCLPSAPACAGNRKER